ncbi:hypothetical protein [Nocardioides sp. SYSU D00038]|uniref:hypothetical protein n=1 Tax=Nocardioides sp. SYSU D00038 TaxID=2812554 RepID=UPI001967FFD9|nr:hypothetical protein [Nocardioides sp. SYSU D00038]
MTLVLVVAGLALAGGCLAALVTQDLTGVDRVQAVGYAGIGAGLAGWGTLRLTAGRQPAVRLDDDGINLADGRTLPWTRVALVTFAPADGAVVLLVRAEGGADLAVARFAGRSLTEARRARAWLRLHRSLVPVDDLVGLDGPSPGSS